ncbi:helix-turn-helix domain-containing protein [Thiocapsa rosea]|uniref:HTH cro/C1-type domain-containing protein n=1 Tax=Thiocapsa rosea TaxID=69360 RepID=A0A495VG38_9GAMM|nr:helix-turn-helix transcriptional regulator [Thiocapsa rosea]RKT46788.1 hypothetical protein BDD21_4325 [Thiocapsa rosea]
MQTHDDLIETLMRRPGVRTEVERLEREEFALLDLLLKARHEAGLSQAQVAERMGTQAPAVARLERALATGRHSHRGQVFPCDIPESPAWRKPGGNQGRTKVSREHREDPSASR